MTWAATAITTVGTVYNASQAGKGGVGQIGTGTTSVRPMEELQAAYGTLASDFEDVQRRGLLGDVQTYSQYERDLIQRGMDEAAAGSQFGGLQEQAASTLLRGQLPQEAAGLYRGVGQMGASMNTPEFMAASQRAVDRAMRPTISQFSQGGRMGSNAFAESLADASVGAFSPLALQARQDDTRNILAAAGGLTNTAAQQANQLSQGVDVSGQVDAAGYADIARGMQFGNLLPSQEYALRQADVTAIERGSDIARNLNVGSETTQPIYGMSEPSSGDILAQGLLAGASAYVGGGGTFGGGGGGGGGGVPMNLGTPNTSSYMPQMPTYQPMDFSGFGTN
jgi:hypothetical protein